MRTRQGGNALTMADMAEYLIPWLDIHAVAERLGMSEAETEDLVYSGALPACRTGRILHIPEMAVDDYQRQSEGRGG